MRRALAGVGASKGLALGRARVRHPHVLTLSEETIAPEAIEAELARLDNAMQAARDELAGCAKSSTARWRRRSASSSTCTC